MDRHKTNIRCTLAIEMSSDNLEGTSKNIPSTIVADETQSTLLETLSSDFVKYLNEQVSTDCVLKAGGVRIPAHRTVLCARSPVFAAMFRHDTAEGRSGEVDIKNLDEATLKDVLYYMYGGKIRGLTSDTAVDLYNAADMYDLPRLKNACMDFLHKNLTVKNICDAAMLSDTHGDLGLEAEVKRFVWSKLEEVIEESHTWKRFLVDKPHLLIKILSGILLEKRANSRRVGNNYCNLCSEFLCGLL